MILKVQLQLFSTIDSAGGGKGGMGAGTPLLYQPEDQEDQEVADLTLILVLELIQVEQEIPLPLVLLKDKMVVMVIKMDLIIKRIFHLHLIGKLIPIII